MYDVLCKIMIYKNVHYIFIEKLHLIYVDVCDNIALKLCKSNELVQLKIGTPNPLYIEQVGHEDRI